MYLSYSLFCTYLAVLKSRKNTNKKSKWALRYKNSLSTNSFSGVRKHDKIRTNINLRVSVRDSIVDRWTYLLRTF